MNPRRIVIAGLGDSGVLTAIRLARHAEVVGISTKPALVSGQELGWRLSRPHDWARANWIPFDRFRGLDRVRTVHGTLTGLDLAARSVRIRSDDGSTSTEEYDALIISTGVTNGFWRQPAFQSAAEIGAGLRATHDRLAASRFGDRGRRRRGGRQQRRQCREDLAGEAGRLVLPERSRPRRASPQGVGARAAQAR